MYGGSYSPGYLLTVTTLSRSSVELDLTQLKLDTGEQAGLSHTNLRLTSLGGYQKMISCVFIATHKHSQNNTCPFTNKQAILMSLMSKPLNKQA